MARILIAGCGDIGAAAARRLVYNGHEVVGLKRHPPEHDDKLHYIKSDLTSTDDIMALDTCFDLVVFILTPDDRSEQSYRNAFELAVNNLLKRFSESASDTRFIFISSTSVYGQTGGEWVDEQSATEPKTITGQIILRAEKAFLSQGAHNCVIRFSGIYGRDRSRLLNTVRKGGEVQYEPPYYTNRIHRDDCVEIILFTANRMLAGEAVDSVYLASDDDPAPKWDVFNYLALMLEVAPPEKAVLPQNADQNKRCCNARLKRLGYEFCYRSYREGYGFIDPDNG
ncbi:MAG: SDR family oxidoreductase [Gammaproteobacteria bacterium]|jgi:nucleoside-diphosphate-sugar epimerase